MRISKLYNAHPLNPRLYAGVSAVVVQAALENIKGVKAYLANKDNWIKEKYKKIVFDHGKPLEQVCLMGGVEKLNGQGEALAATILSQILTRPANCQPVVQGVLSDAVAMALTEPYDIICPFYAVRDIAAVENFNDTFGTTHMHVLKFLDFAIEQTKLLLAAAKKGVLGKYAEYLVRPSLKDWAAEGAKEAKFTSKKKQKK